MSTTAHAEAPEGEAIPTFSLELSQDQRDIRDWVHGFAENVIRPAGAEWDEREETPWPIIGEAAKIGLYGFEFLANTWADSTGLSLPVANEELFWGDSGIGMSLSGTSLAVAAFCSSEPEAGSDVASMRTRAVYDEATDEWVLNGQKAYATNGGIANVHVVTASIDPSLGSRGQAAFVVPPGTTGLVATRKLKKLGLRASHTADVFLDDVRVPGPCLLGGKEKLDERLARAREGTRSSGQAAMQTFEASRPTVGA